MSINFKDNKILFQYIGDDSIVYQTQQNQFLENTGLTIKNPTTNIPVYGLKLNEWGTALRCGHIIDNIAGRLKKNGLGNIILIVDFAGITEVSESFCEQYLNFLLTTPSKIININQNTSINNVFVSYMDSIVDYQEL